MHFVALNNACKYNKYQYKLGTKNCIQMGGLYYFLYEIHDSSSAEMMQ